MEALAPPSEEEGSPTTQTITVTMGKGPVRSKSTTLTIQDPPTSATLSPWCPLRSAGLSRKVLPGAPENPLNFGDKGESRFESPRPTVLSDTIPATGGTTTPPTLARNDSGEIHFSSDHHGEKVRPILSLPLGTDENMGNRGLDSAVADDVSRTVGVITRRQAANLEAILGGSHPSQAMPTTHVAIVVQASLKPASISKAQVSADWKSWDAAIEVELSTMNDLRVWTLTHLPPGARTIKHKWVFLKKMNLDGTLNKYRARLVACGYSLCTGKISLKHLVLL